MDDSNLGKKAEKQIKKWLDNPEEGYCFDRIPDQLTGFYGSKNICDFILYKYPYMYYIESKASWSDRFSFSMLTDNQRDEMLKKSHIKGVFSIVIFLFASHQRAFIFNIQDIVKEMEEGSKSINIKKIAKWSIPHVEIHTIKNRRKELLDYSGNIDELVHKLLNGDEKL